MSDAMVKAGAPAPLGLTPQTYSDARTFAAALAQAQGFVPRAYIGQPAAILAAIVMGAEVGIGPMQALRSIHVVEGKPMLSADLMLALAIRAGVRVEWLRSDAEEARCRLTRPTFPPHEHSFTIAEAKAAGLAGRGNWSKYAPAMLRARCISAALRAWSPDVLGGGVYVEGELEEPRERPAPQPPASTVVAVLGQEHAVPFAMAGGAADVADAEYEAACASPQQPAEAEPPAAEAACAGRAPGLMSECRTADELQAWLASGWGAEIARRGKVAAVEKYAERIGVSVEDARRWCGVEEAAE